MKAALAATGLAISVLSQSVLAGSTSTGGEWKHSFAPLFLWGVSIDGSATIGGNAAPLELDFKNDILENMEAVFTFRYEARNDHMGLFVEYQYLNITPNVGMESISANIDFKSTMFEAGMAYALNDSATTRWEVMGGVRFTEQEVDIDVTVDLPPLPAGFPDEIGMTINGGDDWLHPFLGGRVEHSINDNWSFVGRADYGFAGSDNTALNVSALVDYRFRKWGSVFFGYRYLDYNFANDKYGVDDYGYDANQQGPLLGLNLHW